MPTPESWYAEAQRILERERRPAEPSGPTDCGKACGTCDACMTWLLFFPNDWPDTSER